MFTRIDRTHRALPVLLGILTLAGVAVLLLWDAVPAIFPARGPRFSWGISAGHDRAGLPGLSKRASSKPAEWLKAVLLAIAFLFWSANQFWSNPHQAIVFNDIAIALCSSLTSSW
jgi:hypothetical protein